MSTISQQDLLALYNTGTAVRTTDRFLIHTSTGRLLEVSAEAVRAYLKKNFEGIINIDAQGNVYVNGVTTGYKLEPAAINEMKNRLDALEEDLEDIMDGGGCKCSDMGDHLTTPLDSTQIKVKNGDDMLHITLADIKEYLADEYAPKWTNATCVLSFGNGFSSVMEIGSTQPTESDFSFSGSTAKAVSSAGTATGGAASSNSVSITYNATSKLLTAVGTRTYDAGTTAVKTSKGKTTNKTASNAITLISSASVNGDIDSSTFVIKSLSRTATLNIAYVYALYANTTSIGTQSKQPLSVTTSAEFSFPAETSSLKHSFEIPTSYTLTKVEIYNSFSKDYEEYQVSNFSTSSTTHNDASGTSVNYKKYTRNDGTNGATIFRITFSK